ncbi:MAG: toxin-antitoxin system HicB family antitoxin [Firmicutes bacterium]|nr:toxin-antitoxin system HicB family antitoxin [Bacillota bacterium]
MGGRTSSQAKDSYNNRVYERIVVRVKKGSKEKLKIYAAKQGRSLNRYIHETIERDSGIMLCSKDMQENSER